MSSDKTNFTRPTAAPEEEPRPGAAGSTSAAKLAANRANAQLSTGPVTQPGKTISARNTRKHGFYAKRLFEPVEVGNEEHQEYVQMLEAMRGDWQPAGALEEVLVEKIVAEMLRYGRWLALERKVLPQLYECRSVDPIMRCQATINRHLFQAIAQLERLQRQRKGEFVPAPVSVDLRCSSLETRPAELFSQAAIPVPHMTACAMEPPVNDQPPEAPKEQLNGGGSQASDTVV
jgi:hypothetical protein